MKPAIELQTILKELYNISGFRISVHDTQMNEIAAYPRELSSFCGFIQKNAAVYKTCVANDAAAFEVVKKKADIHIYRCPFGLYEAIAPLYQFGVLSGYLMMGQTLDAMQDSRSYVYDQVKPYFSERDELSRLIQKIPSCSREKMLSCISIMRICAEYLTLTNRMNLSDRSLAHEIKKHLNEQYAQKLTIDQLSRRFFCSPPTLMSTFKKAYGQTISQYLTQIRLEHAKELLSSPLSIREIAERCGFSDQNYFSKVFLKEIGTTPSACRAALRESPSNFPIA